MRVIELMVSVIEIVIDTLNGLCSIIKFSLPFKYQEKLRVRNDNCYLPISLKDSTVEVTIKVLFSGSCFNALEVCPEGIQQGDKTAQFIINIMYYFI